MTESRRILQSGLVSVVPVLTTTRLFTIPSGIVRVVPRRIDWINRTGGNGFLRIGYTTLGAAFTPVYVDIWMLNNIPDWMTLPLIGNGPQGFSPDTTAGTGTLGHIDVQSTVGGAAPTDVLINLEVEVI